MVRLGGTGSDPCPATNQPHDTGQVTCLPGLLWGGNTQDGWGIRVARVKSGPPTCSMGRPAFALVHTKLTGCCGGQLSPDPTQTLCTLWGTRKSPLAVLAVLTPLEARQLAHPALATESWSCGSRGKGCRNVWALLMPFLGGKDSVLSFLCTADEQTASLKMPTQPTLASGAELGP